MIARSAIPLLLLLLPLLAAASESGRNWFEWSATAPIVLSGESLGHNGRFFDLIATDVFRGDVEPGSRVRIDLRFVNRGRDREKFSKALKVDVGREYVVLLRSGGSRRSRKEGGFDLVRGLEGVRALPVEGAAALVAAMEQLVAIQEMKSDGLQWDRFAELLADPNPTLVETALEQFLKFRRGEPETLELLRLLLDHPRDDIREQASRLVGQILTRHAGSPIPEETSLRNDLVGRARRDPSVPVRVAATGALSGFEVETIRPVLEEIARVDPEQEVRYVAQKIMLDARRETGARN